jgi:hypothetical protein
VRIADAVYNTSAAEMRPKVSKPSSYETNYFDEMQFGDSMSSAETLVSDGDGGALDADERKILDRIGEDLARLGRVKRVGLGVKEKQEFVKVWMKTRKVL